MRGDDLIVEYTFTTTVEKPPYLQVSGKFRNGIKQTAFHEHMGRFGKVLKVHNTYLKPYFIVDPLTEYWALRTHAGLFDVTGEQVIEVAGPDAFDLMNELVPRDLTRLPDGHCLYTVMCYDHGGIVEDAVLIRFDRTRFWWVGGLGHAETWLWGNAQGRAVTVTNRLDDIHIACIQGPKARQVLQQLCAADISGLPFYAMIEADVAGVPCVITRTGYTMELGYEVYVAVDRGGDVFAALKAGTEAAGGVLCGSGCMGIRRIEAGLIDFGADFDWHHTPYEVGLAWMLNTRKPPWRGRDALIGTDLARPARRLAGLALAGDTAPGAGAPVLADGTVVGEIRSATMSPTLRHPIAIARMDVDATALDTAVQVAHGAQRLSGTVTRMPFLDPERALARA